jgi:hypothetical protein
LKELNFKVAQIRTTITEYLEFSRDTKYKHQDIERLERGIAGVTLFINSLVERDYLALPEDSPLTPLFKPPHAYWLLTHYPMFCGEILFALHASMQFLGPQICT